MSTYAGVKREIPILTYPASQGLAVARGMCVEWSLPDGVAKPWLFEDLPFGVATNDLDRDLWEIDVYVAKGSSVLIKCETGVVPNPNDFLYRSIAQIGLVTNIAGG